MERPNTSPLLTLTSTQKPSVRGTTYCAFAPMKRLPNRARFGFNGLRGYLSPITSIMDKSPPIRIITETHEHFLSCFSYRKRNRTVSFHALQNLTKRRY